NHLGFQVAMLVGPALSGVLTGSLGLTMCYLACAGAVATVLWLPSVPAPDSAGAGRRLTMTWEGIRHVSRPGAVRGAFGTDLFATVLVMPISLFPMINDLRLGGSAETLGLMTSALAVGGFL